MSDPRLSRMLRSAGEEPSPQFVSRLRRDLLAGFDDAAAGPSTASVAEELDRGRTTDDGFVPLRKPPASPQRRRWPLLVAAGGRARAGGGGGGGPPPPEPPTRIVGSHN